MARGLGRRGNASSDPSFNPISDADIAWSSYRHLQIARRDLVEFEAPFVASEGSVLLIENHFCPRDWSIGLRIHDGAVNGIRGRCAILRGAKRSTQKKDREETSPGHPNKTASSGMHEELSNLDGSITENS